MGFKKAIIGMVVIGAFMFFACSNIPMEEVTAVLQNGLNGYQGTEDSYTFLAYKDSSVNPNANYGTDSTIFLFNCVA